MYKSFYVTTCRLRFQFNISTVIQVAAYVSTFHTNFKYIWNATNKIELNAWTRYCKVLSTINVKNYFGCTKLLNIIKILKWPIVDLIRVGNDETGWKQMGEYEEVKSRLSRLRLLQFFVVIKSVKNHKICSVFI